MTERLYLHVGAPKSGTTYLQRVLETNREALSRAGVLVVGDHQRERVHAAMVVREDPRLEALGERARDAWRRLVASIRDWDGPSAVLSYELFAGASADQVRTALADLTGIEVHVVITARDFARGVPSAWQERLKFALTTPLEEWRPKPESAGPRAEWSWRTMDPSGVAARWGVDLPAEQVHVVTVPRSGAPRTELWQRFAAACGLERIVVEAEPETVNESLGVTAAELLRRVNQHLEPPLASSNREQARWLRDLLAHGILVDFASDPIGLTPEQFDEARELSERAIDRLRTGGYRVHGDLEDLRATRPDGRTPGEVTDSELLDQALVTVVRLLERLRDEQSDRTADLAAPPPADSRSRARRLASRAVEAGRGVEVRRLEQRVADLEAELREARTLQLRVAELTDVVAELLTPGADLDEATLRRYREESL